MILDHPTWAGNSRVDEAVTGPSLVDLNVPNLRILFLMAQVRSGTGVNCALPGTGIPPVFGATSQDQSAYAPTLRLDMCHGSIHQITIAHSAKMILLSRRCDGRARG